MEARRSGRCWRLPPRTRFVDKAKYRNYLRKSEEFERSAMQAAGREDWDASVANAIHSGISMADALAVFYLGKRSAAQEHEESVALLLLQLGIDRKEVGRAASHLGSLLRVKNRAEYEERLLGRRDSEQALKHLGRFKEWARAKLPR